MPRPGAQARSRAPQAAPEGASQEQSAAPRGRAGAPGAQQGFGEVELLRTLSTLVRAHADEPDKIGSALLELTKVRAIERPWLDRAYAVLVAQFGPVFADEAFAPLTTEGGPATDPRLARLDGMGSSELSAIVFNASGQQRWVQRGGRWEARDADGVSLELYRAAWRKRQQLAGTARSKPRPTLNLVDSYRGVGVEGDSRSARAAKAWEARAWRESGQASQRLSEAEGALANHEADVMNLKASDASQKDKAPRRAALREQEREIKAELRQARAEEKRAAKALAEVAEARRAAARDMGKMAIARQVDRFQQQGLKLAGRREEASKAAAAAQREAAEAHLDVVRLWADPRYEGAPPEAETTRLRRRHEAALSRVASSQQAVEELDGLIAEVRDKEAAAKARLVAGRRAPRPFTPGAIDRVVRGEGALRVHVMGKDGKPVVVMLPADTSDEAIREAVNKRMGLEPGPKEAPGLRERLREKVTTDVATDVVRVGETGQLVEAFRHDVRGEESVLGSQEWSTTRAGVVEGGYSLDVGPGRVSASVSGKAALVDVNSTWMWPVFGAGFMGEAVDARLYVFARGFVGVEAKAALIANAASQPIKPGGLPTVDFDKLTQGSGMKADPATGIATPEGKQRGVDGSASAFAGAKLTLGAGMDLRWHKKGQDHYDGKLARIADNLVDALSMGSEGLAWLLDQVAAEEGAQKLLSALFEWGAQGIVPLIGIEAQVEGSAGAGAQACFKLRRAGGRFEFKAGASATYGVGMGTQVVISLDAVEGMKFALICAGELYERGWDWAIDEARALGGEILGAVADLRDWLFEWFAADDKVREAVAQGAHRFVPPRERGRMIATLCDGGVANASEDAILEIITYSASVSDLALVLQSAKDLGTTIDDLYWSIDGRQDDLLDELLTQQYGRSVFCECWWRESTRIRRIKRYQGKWIAVFDSWRDADGEGDSKPWQKADGTWETWLDAPRGALEMKLHGGGVIGRFNTPAEAKDAAEGSWWFKQG